MATQKEFDKAQVRYEAKLVDTYPEVALEDIPMCHNCSEGLNPFGFCENPDCEYCGKCSGKVNLLVGVCPTCHE